MSNKLNMMKQVPIFRHLSQEELAEISRITTRRSLNKGTILYLEGASKQSLFFIRKGLVKTYKTDSNQKQRITGYYKKGDVFPQIGFSNTPEYTTSAACIVQTDVLALPITPLKQLLLDHPSIAIKFIDTLGERIQQLQTTLQSTTGEMTEHYGKLFLLKLAEHVQVDHPEQHIRIGIPMTYKELAETIGTSREQARRFIMRLREGGIVDMERTGFIIHDVEALRQWQE